MKPKMQIYAGSVATTMRTGDVISTPVHMEAISYAAAVEAAFKAVKPMFNKDDVYEHKAAFNEITPEWLKKVGYEPIRYFRSEGKEEP